MGTGVTFLVMLSMLGRVVETAVVGGAGFEGASGGVFAGWRLLALLPVLLYAATVVVNVPVPNVRNPETRWYFDGKMRIPEFGRGVLLFVGILVAIFSTLQATSFLPEGGSEPAFLLPMQDLTIATIAVVVLRSLLGWLRLLPRSWRVEPEPPGLSHEVPLRIPAQRFAPARGTGAGDA